jgi:hypothetical protein
MARRRNPYSVEMGSLAVLLGAGVLYYLYTKQSAASSLAVANGSTGTTVPINPTPDDGSSISGLGALHRDNPYRIGPGYQGKGEIINVFGNPVWSGE